VIGLILDIPPPLLPPELRELEEDEPELELGFEELPELEEEVPPVCWLVVEPPELPPELDEPGLTPPGK